MPDRDPALEVALTEYSRHAGYASVGFPDGWHAAFRSLCCETPEAQAALRELVRAITAFDKHKTSFTRNQILCAESAFALLADWTEANVPEEASRA